MQVTLDKQDLIALVSGSSPKYSVFNHPVIKQAGSYHDGTTQSWVWNKEYLDCISEQELWELCLLCKNSDFSNTGEFAIKQVTSTTMGEQIDRAKFIRSDMAAGREALGSSLVEALQKKPTSGHVIGTNAQLQALRPELVKLGFIDDPKWNDTYGVEPGHTIMAIYGYPVGSENYPNNKIINLLHQVGAGWYRDIDHCFYTIPENEAPEVSAKKIRDAYYEVNP